MARPTPRSRARSAARPTFGDRRVRQHRDAAATSGSTGLRAPPSARREAVRRSCGSAVAVAHVGAHAPPAWSARVGNVGRPRRPLGEVVGGIHSRRRSSSADSTATIGRATPPQLLDAARASRVQWCERGIATRRRSCPPASGTGDSPRPAPRRRRGRRWAIITGDGSTAVTSRSWAQLVAAGRADVDDRARRRRARPRSPPAIRGSVARVRA